MKKNLICIICPRGCSLQVEETQNGLKVSGNACKKGEEYGIAETTNPVRTVTSIVRVSNRRDVMVSVKTAKPIKKEHIFDLMSKIRSAEIEAPINIGDIIIENVFGTNVIATKNVD